MVFRSWFRFLDIHEDLFAEIRLKNGSKESEFKGYFDY